MFFPEAELLRYDSAIVLEVCEKVGVNDFLEDFTEDVEQADGSVAMGISVGFTRFWGSMYFGYLRRREI